ARALAATARAARRRRPHGAHQLSSAVARVHDALLWLWVRPARPLRRRCRARAHVRHLDRRARAEHALAAPLSLWPGGIVVAFAPLPKHSADATRENERPLRFFGRLRRSPAAPALPQLLAHFRAALARQQHGRTDANQCPDGPLCAREGGDGR